MFWDSVAYAMAPSQGANGGGGNPIGAFLPLIIMFAIFYFLLIRPQQKKAKAHKELLSNLKKGDYILTGGGFYGRITAVNGDVLTVDLGNDNKVKINRGFVSGLAEPTSSGEGKKEKD
ncbi:MAG: preprotein translocase subunit YajC [Desulfovibrionales bacterium]